MKTLNAFHRFDNMFLKQTGTQTMPSFVPKFLCSLPTQILTPKRRQYALKHTKSLCA